MKFRFIKLSDPPPKKKKIRVFFKFALYLLTSFNTNCNNFFFLIKKFNYIFNFFNIFFYLSRFNNNFDFTRIFFFFDKFFFFLKLWSKKKLTLNFLKKKTSRVSFKNVLTHKKFIFWNNFQSDKVINLSLFFANTHSFYLKSNFNTLLLSSNYLNFFFLTNLLIKKHSYFLYKKLVIYAFFNNFYIYFQNSSVFINLIKILNSNNNFKSSSFLINLNNFDHTRVFFTSKNLFSFNESYL
jgi:hypothetical protein